MRSCHGNMEADIVIIKQKETSRPVDRNRRVSFICKGLCNAETYQHKKAKEPATIGPIPWLNNGERYRIRICDPVIKSRTGLT